MPLTPDEIERMAASLAAAHASGRESREAALHRLTGMADAENIQEAMLRMLADAQVGYALGASSPTTARLLGTNAPILAPLLRGSLLDDGSTYLLPQGTIGLGAGFCFVLGRPLEDVSDGPAGDRKATDACIACHLELHILGRRVPHGTPLNEWTATADLGLEVVHVLGPRVTDWRSIDLTSTVIRVRLDGNAVTQGHGSDAFGAPVGAVAWTARWLAGRGRRIEAGELVTTGSLTGLVRVIPGQRVSADVEGVGAVTLNLI